MRLILLFIAIALIALGLWSISRRGTPRHIDKPPAAAAKEVPIQDGKTLDFSSGKAVVKDSAAEKAAIDRSVAQMDAAAADVTFVPKSTATTSSATTSTARK
jgi:hypothetical protein